jgi:hypothetical protein
MNSQTLPTAQNLAARSDAASTLLRGLIDYAGLFPPASLAMRATVANYDEYSRSEWSWILGRLIVPVGRLAEFEEAYAELPRPTKASVTQWRISALIVTGADATADVARISEFNSQLRSYDSSKRAAIESVEVRVATPEEITRLSVIIPGELETYFEIPPSNAAECITAVAACGRRAKLRTGGETADKIPAPENVIEFMRECAALNVPFKATAGLHHPLRSIHRLTYQPDSASGVMHGFLNVFLAAAFLRLGMHGKVAAQLIEEKSASAFNFGSGGVSWGEHRLSQREIAIARDNFALSFGSCSFTEPIDDLRSLHLL